MIRRLVKVFRVRYEHALSGTRAEYAVVSTSEIKALQEVLRIQQGFTIRDTVCEVCTRTRCTVTAKPWVGPVPTIAGLVGATGS